MNIGDQVYWYDISWISGQLSVHSFNGRIQNFDYGSRTPSCMPDGGGCERGVPRELVKATLKEAKEAARSWITGEKKSYADMFNNILNNL